MALGCCRSLGIGILALTVAAVAGAGFAAGQEAPTPGTAAAPVVAGTASAPPAVVVREDRSLAEVLSAWWAFPIGVLGSAAYLVAVWVGMVGRGGDARDRVLGFFSPWAWLKVPLYLASGGGVALVFQLPEKKLVPIQAFIIGCTWPAVVANYLSGRQTGVPEEVERKAESLRKQETELEKLKVTLESLPTPHQPSDSDKDLQDLLDALKGHRG